MERLSEKVKNKCIFLDRDGIINKICKHPELVDIKGKICTDPLSLDEFKLFPGVKDAILKFKKLCYKVVVVSNQPGLIKGFYKETVLEEINNFLKSELGVEEVYYCLHHPDYSGKCDCRKPELGLLLKAAKESNIDLNKSYMVGDKESDILAGRRANCKTVLITDDNKTRSVQSDFVFKSLIEFANFLKI